MDFLVNILLVLSALALLPHIVASLSLIRERRRAPRRGDGGEPPFVSILKPLKGIDDQLEANLETFFAIDYPAYELVFCAAEPDEPALQLARRLQARHPDVPSQVVVGASKIGLNPKVRVLAQATPKARGELLLISDSNVRVRPEFLRETVNELDSPEIAVVSNLVAGVEERSLGATLENLQLNGFIAPAICLGLTLKAPTCVVGKSMLLRRSELEAVGGWESLSDVLAEDFVLGQRLAERGRRAVISPHLVETVNEHWSLGRFFERHDRWLKMRWRINPSVLILELLANVTFWAALAVVISKFEPGAVATAGLIVGTRALVEALSTSQLRPDLRLHRLALVPVRDLALALLWLHARLSRTIRWREGQRLLVGRNSSLSLPAPATPPTAKAAGNPLGLPDTSTEPTLTPAARDIY